MKKAVFVIITVLTAFLGFGQKTYSFKSGGGILENGIKMTPNKVRLLLANDQKNLALYDAGRSKKTFGNVFIYGGIATMITKLFVDLNSSTLIVDNTNPYNTKQETRSATGYILGGVMILTGGIIKGGFSKKIKKVVANMNENQKNPKIALIESSSIIVDSDGVGIAFTF
jgi:hypothetical protein